MFRKCYFYVVLVAIYFNRRCNVYVCQLTLIQPLEVISQYGSSLLRNPHSSGGLPISIRYSGNNFSFMNKNLPSSTSPLTAELKIKSCSSVSSYCMKLSVDRSDLMVAEALIACWVSLKINLCLVDFCQKLAFLVMFL